MTVERPGPADRPDHRAVLAGLPPALRAALTRRRDGPALRRLAVYLLLCGALGAGALGEGPAGWAARFALGVMLVFLFALHHEAIHRTAFARGWLNDAVARACGLVLFLPSDWFRFFHFAHHRHTQDPDRDPELARPRPHSLAGYLWYLSGLPTWAGHVRVLLRNAAGRNADPFVPEGAKARVAREARAMLAVYAGMAGLFTLAEAWEEALRLWLVPILLGQPVLRAYLLAEHARCPPVANMLANTRTTLTTAAVRWLAWNMPYHAEHHAMPEVPFFALPELHRHIAPHLRVTAPGYAAFNADYARAALRGELVPPTG